MKPLVSVYCLAYNHEKYIKDALEGFVHQETNFPYEVIVHDDASTDQTKSIIMEYAAKYPNVIVPIFQTENQYSMGVNIYHKYILPHLHGKYIASCEGDDYWCDNRKLQKQVEWLENHPEYSLCVHNTKIVNCINNQEGLINSEDKDRNISIAEIIEWKGKAFQTSSYMYRVEYAQVPSAFSIPGIGDYSKAMYLATCGKVRYLGDVMSVYRYLTSGSWSIKMYKATGEKDKSIEHWCNRIAMLKRVNEYTDGQYSAVINHTIQRNEFNILLKQNNIKKIRKDYMDFYKQLGLKEKMRLWINYVCPCALKTYYRITTRSDK